MFVCLYYCYFNLNFLLNTSRLPSEIVLQLSSADEPGSSGPCAAIRCRAASRVRGRSPPPGCFRRSAVAAAAPLPPAAPAERESPAGPRLRARSSSRPLPRRSETAGAGSGDFAARRRLALSSLCRVPIGRSAGRRCAGLANFKAGRGGGRPAMEAVRCAEHGEGRRRDWLLVLSWSSRSDGFLSSAPGRVPLLSEDGRPRWS